MQLVEILMQHRPLQGGIPVGDLNYVISRICWQLCGREVQNQSSPVGNIRYQRLNDVLGAIEGAKLEMYRRIAGPYEDEKIQSNGDV